jgi:predicted secreted protein
MGVLESFVVFVISWWIVFLPTLSAGTRSQHEADSVSPGTDRSAPVKIAWLPKIVVATAGAAAITFLIWLALRSGWLDFMIPRA